MKQHGLSEDGSTITLRKFDGNFCVPRSKRGLILDVETTGLDFDKDEIIQAAALPFEFNPETGLLLSVGQTFVSLREPEEPLSEFITNLTGFTDEDLEGAMFDEQGLEGLMDSADYIFAHNAAFDRNMVEALLGERDDNWVCTLNSVDWKGLGAHSSKQIDLAAYHGFFYDAHRADADVEALLHLISFHNDTLDCTYLSAMVAYSEVPRVRVGVSNTDFADKSKMNALKFLWNPSVKGWHKDMTLTDYEEIRDQLQALGTVTTRNVNPLAKYRR
jgi:DNA polymerase III subunit epsilon